MEDEGDISVLDLLSSIDARLCHIEEQLRELQASSGWPMILDTIGK